MSNKNNLQKKLNLNYTWLASQVYKEGPYDIPILHCKDDYIPDFIALYSETGIYHKTKYTTICFHQNDDVFNGIDGLCNAVYYDNKARLKYFKDRFADCHYFIMPDCSLTYDQDSWDIIFRTALMRLTCLWLTFELKAHVVPLITYGIDDTFNLMITGLKECETVAFSLKGSLLEKYKEEQLKRVIKYTVDNLHNLKSIIIYDDCMEDETVYKLFEHATNKGIKLLIPPNTLKNQNRGKKVAKNG